jgi:hypothetical protein
VADEGEQQEDRTLEMRVAELENKLAQVHITEDDMKAFRKVASALGGGAAAAPAGGGTVAGGCVVDCAGGCLNECAIRQPIVRQPIVIRQPISIRQCTWECFECGPGLPGASGNIGGFGQFGG